MKLEFKYIAPYVPFELKFMSRYDSQPWTLVGLQKDNMFPLQPTLLAERCDYKNVINIWCKNAKLILHPLLDLTKEEFSGTYNLLRVHIGKSKLKVLINEGYGVLDLPYFIVESLLENHFDIYRLIENDLAVDVNTLK